MTWIGRRIGASSRLAPISAISLILSVGLGLGWTSHVEAGKIGRFLTAKDVTGREILDQNGLQIQLPSAADRHPLLATGSMPTYLAIPLKGGEHLPSSIPTIETGSQQGENPVGPLNFDALVKANLNAALNTSKLVVIDTPSQNYLVEFLPRQKHSTSVPTTTVNELAHLLNTGQTQLTKLTQSSMTDLEKLLHISSKNSTSTPSLNLEAQVLDGDVLPAAIPEPSTWMVFGSLLAGGAVLQRRARRSECA